MSDSIIIRPVQDSVVVSGADRITVAAPTPDTVTVSVQDSVVVETEVVRVVETCGPCPVGGSSASPASGAGALFATDASGAGVVSALVFQPGTVPADTVLLECTSDNPAVVLYFMAEGGLNYSPTVTVDGIECDNLQQYGDDRRLFFGSVTVTVTEDRIIPLESDTGARSTVLVHRAAAGPVITRAEFFGGYPGSQTEVKAGDTIQAKVWFDLVAGSDPDLIRVADYGCTDGGDFAVTWAEAGVALLTLTIAATGNTPTQFPFCVTGRNSFGTWGDEFCSNTLGAVDGVNYVTCCDLAPSFSDGGVAYPVGQSALKGTEQATQTTTILNADSAVYSSPNGHLSIADPAVMETAKVVTCTHPGTYNDSATSFRIVATRAANGKSATFNKVIEVADVAPVVTVTQPYARLRSSPSGSNYTITATSNQALAGAPSVASPVSGAWQGAGFTGGPKIWNRIIKITDGDAAGTGAWFWSGAAPVNRAGLSATISGNEVVGGFTSRTLTIPSWPNREADIGTSVASTAKLTCENLSKGGDGPNGGTIFSYQATTSNAADRYTITGPTGMENPTGWRWYNCDQANAVANTAGIAQVIVEEVV